MNADLTKGNTFYQPKMKGLKKLLRTQKRQTMNQCPSLPTPLQTLSDNRRLFVK